MGVNPGDYWRCRKCGLRSYCTMFLKCESCGYQEDGDKDAWRKSGSNRPHGVDEP